MTLREFLKGIADAIRTVEGSTGDIPAPTYRERILALSGGGGGGGPFCKVSVMEGHGGEIVNATINIRTAVSMTSALLDYWVESVSGASYGFSKNSNGYYQSRNKGVNSSYAMCKVFFQAETERMFTLNCINYAETNWDFGIISEVDTMLSMDNSEDSSGVLKSFKGQSSADVVSVPITVPAGTHFVCVKFRKDGSGNNNNDTLQFAVAV